MAQRKRTSMRGVTVVNKKTGNVSVLLNPAQKGRKYAAELKHGKALTNSLQRKKNKDGSQKKLSVKQKAYRAGYLDARKDNAKCFKAIKKKRRSQATRKR